MSASTRSLPLLKPVVTLGYAFGSGDGFANHVVDEAVAVKLRRVEMVDSGCKRLAQQGDRLIPLPVQTFELHRAKTHPGHLLRTQTIAAAGKII